MFLLYYIQLAATCRPVDIVTLTLSSNDTNKQAMFAKLSADGAINFLSEFVNRFCEGKVLITILVVYCERKKYTAFQV